jgi:hypothetical protein
VWLTYAKSSGVVFAVHKINAQAAICLVLASCQLMDRDCLLQLSVTAVMYAVFLLHVRTYGHPSLGVQPQGIAGESSYAWHIEGCWL